MDVCDQTRRCAARLYAPTCIRVVRSLTALGISSLCAVLLSFAPPSAKATLFSVSTTAPDSQLKIVAPPTTYPHSVLNATSDGHTVFLPLIMVPQAGQASGGPPAAGTGDIAIGVYQPQQDTSGAAIDRYIQQVGQKPAFAWQPTTWQRQDGSYKPLDPQLLDEYRIRGITPGLTWEPSRGAVEAYADRQAAINQPLFSWQQIISGTHDAYITQFAQAAAEYHYPFLLRVLHEMNGTWYPWGSGVNGNTQVADLVAAYRHIVDLFRAAGATNVQFVWNPNAINASVMSQYGGLLKQAYPGDSYVNWVALDGYNNNVDNWRSLQDIYKPSYQLITSFTSRPMILFEVGSLENPQDSMARANWITQGFLTTIPSQFPNVKVAAWFNSQNGSGRDFALDTPEALDAWRQVAASPSYQGSLFK